MYHSWSDLTAQAAQRGVSPGTVVLENECALTGADAASVLRELRTRWGIMLTSCARALEQPQDMVLGLISGQSEKQKNYGQRHAPLCGALLNDVMAHALSACEVNASMGRICAAPTAGSCGILPAVVQGVARMLGSTEEQLDEALLVACGVGAVIMRNATVAGAEGGCQAECGTAAAMAGAAAVSLSGGTLQQMDACIAIVLMNCMGLVCDPVAGLVQLPCSFRNASQAVNALISADLALAGQDSIIPADEAVVAMFKVGRQLPPQLRETAGGGVAATPTGKALKKQLKENGSSENADSAR